MHIVAVGGSGFIGSHFVRRALQGGHRLTVVSRSLRSRPDQAPVDFLDGGITTLIDSPSLLTAADVVCHFASTTIPATANSNPVADIRENLEMTVSLLEAMRRHGNRRIVYLSSGGAVYGRPEHLPIREDHATNPIGAYGVSKLAIEKYLFMYQQLHGFRTAVIRPANPYGRGQGRIGQLGAVTTFLDLALSGGTARIWGDGSTVRDFVHVSDLAEMAMAIVEQDADGIFNCGGGRGVSLNELMDLVETMTGRTLQREFLPARDFDPPRIVLDIGRAVSVLGWRVRVSLEQGLEELIREGLRDGVG